ncbi:hypothetical protein [Burkholderia gladioli]|uniref:hypothetical protein n=1 Tax=Burkholderia gladioli TaxID=28095 RepID=UPI00264B81CC|nr:hypothetical protein [Burkholderia gladioli]MDN7753627.1 hypothetical protein [Burkholderia gladioli]
MSRPEHYRLHVPLETTTGRRLEAPPDGLITVRGRRAQLFEREPHIAFETANAMVIKQWLLFDPLPESEARNLLADLRARLPVHSMNNGASFRIRNGDPEVASAATYDGARPTLVPDRLSPEPAWDDPVGGCNIMAQDFLGGTLEESPPVTDERVRAALELYIASEYEFLPRTLFLAKMTVLDGLATGAKRSAGVAEWIDQIVAEATDKFDDPGLSGGLRYLKDESRGSAIRGLVRRAVISLGGSDDEADRQAKVVGKLYSARSKLSHESAIVDLDHGLATQLARLVLNAAALNPSILDVGTGEDASRQSGLQWRAQWTAEAGAAIRLSEPDGDAVVDVVRRPLVMGQYGPLIARLANGSVWLISSGEARRLSHEEMADWAACDESFGTLIKQ